MDADPRRLWRLASVLAAAVLAWIVVLQASEKVRFRRDGAPLPLGVASPVLALELAPTTDDVEAILLAGDGCANVSALKLHLAEDVVFIALYVPLLAVVGLLALPRPGWARRAVVLMAAATGALDLVEDLGLWEIATTITREAATRTVRGPALAKWALFFATAALIAWLWRRTPLPVAGWVRRTIVASAAAAAALGALGFAKPPAIGWSFGPMLVLLVAVVVAGWRERRRPPPDGDGAPA